MSGWMTLAGLTFHLRDNDFHELRFGSYKLDTLYDSIQDFPHDYATFVDAVRRNTSVHTLILEMDDGYQRILPFLDALGYLRGLKSMHAEGYPYGVFDAVGLGRVLRNATSIQHLSLKCPGHRWFDAEVTCLADCLSKLRNLDSFEVKGIFGFEKRRGLARICMALEATALSKLVITVDRTCQARLAICRGVMQEIVNIRTLEHLKLDAFLLHESDCACLKTMTQEDSLLESLWLEDCMFVGGSGLDFLSFHCQNKSALRVLTLLNADVCWKEADCPRFLPSPLDIVSPYHFCNGLQELTLDFRLKPATTISMDELCQIFVQSLACCRSLVIVDVSFVAGGHVVFQAWDHLVESIALLLQEATDLTHFSLHLPREFGVELKEATINSLHDALKKNYQVMHFNCLPLSGPMTETFTRLNRHGRDYLKDAADLKRGVELLSATSDDLDCLFVHLLENPFLCDGK